MKETTPDKAEAALAQARLLAEKGDYAGSLKKHVWFHENALTIHRSYYGVRLSFALADWIRLGTKFPPARKKLKAIRDEKTTRSLRPRKSRELFHDVVAINHYLGEPGKTVKLFKRIDSVEPRFASKVFALAETDLVAKKEFKLARKHLGDPFTRLAKAKADFEEGLEFARQKGRSRSRRVFERMFTEDVVRIITILRRTGDPLEARKIQRTAQSVLDSRIIRNAFKV